MRTSFPTVLLACITWLLLLAGCEDQAPSTEPPAPQKPAPQAAAGCRQCHQVDLDPAHDLGCTTCHQGNQEGRTQTEAHAGLIAEPAHPSSMATTCGRCHAELVQNAAHSLHFTLRNEVNAVRQVFGAREELPSLTAIPDQPSPDTILELTDDLLRRRCLRCHVYYEGDPYPETTRGTGCAACHLAYSKGEMRSHRFVGLPTDGQCLHCHYANRVGADYYGRYEHDFNWDYRTPFPVTGNEARPYGVEYHQLIPDVHQLGGLECIDCHPGSELMGPAHASAAAPGKLTCKTCHARPANAAPVPNLARENGQVVLTTRRGGRKIEVPQLQHPAHQTYAGKATCVLCHAQWSYNDQGVHLMRHDVEDYEPWFYLTTQSCYEVEYLLEANLFGAGTEYGPRMTDKITGLPKPGIWYKGYELRRWEFPLICRGADGKLTICRPILDLYLSYVNSEDEVVFDSVPAQDQARGIRPYTPHTIGKAGSFFQERLQVRDELSGNRCLLDQDQPDE